MKTIVTHTRKCLTLDISAIGRVSYYVLVQMIGGWRHMHIKFWRGTARNVVFNSSVVCSVRFIKINKFGKNPNKFHLRFLEIINTILK